MYELRRMCCEMPEEGNFLDLQGGMVMSLKDRIADGLRLLYCDIRSAKWAVMFIIAYFVLLKKIFKSLCPMVFLTGFPCPGCGLTRAGIHVLRFEFAAAWQIHPFIFAVIGLAAVFAAERYFLKREEMRVTMWCAVMVIVSLILFYIYRMVLLFPNVPPMTYYRHNLLRNLLRGFPF